jgi:hypothetical protein
VPGDRHGEDMVEHRRPGTRIAVAGEGPWRSMFSLWTTARS